MFNREVTILKRSTLIAPLIIIMFICAILRIFVDYQRWPTIVVAISIASWFLALADFCIAQSQALQDNVYEQIDASEIALGKAAKIKKYAQTRQKQTTIALRSVTEIQRYASMELKVQMIEKKVTRYCKNLRKAVKGNKLNCKIGTCLTVLGYLILLGFMFFAPNIESGSCDLDELAIWSFIIMLLGYFFGDLQVEQRAKQKSQSEEAISALDAMEAELRAEVINNAD